MRQVARSELSSTSWKQQLVVVQAQSDVRYLRKNSVEENDERVKVEMFYLVNRCMIELLQQNFQRSQAISLFLSWDGRRARSHDSYHNLRSRRSSNGVPGSPGPHTANPACSRVACAERTCFQHVSASKARRQRSQGVPPTNQRPHRDTMTFALSTAICCLPCSHFQS